MEQSDKRKAVVLDSEPSKFIVFRGQSIGLYRADNGRYYDILGTEYAFTDSSLLTDPRAVCGVGIFSLPEGHRLNDACAPHDFAYSSPTYQAYHTRAEADFYLMELLKLKSSDDSITPELFYNLASTFGGPLWENDETND